mgnify:CR=1 FL=1
MMVSFINKRGQHEIAGFVLIVLIVSVIGVVFLSIAFAKGPTEQNSFEVSNLLESSMYSTTNCAINYVPQYRDIQDLIKECYKDQSGNYRECLIKKEDILFDDENLDIDLLTERGDVCEVLERDFKALIDEGLQVGEGAVNRGYKLDIYFSYGDEVNPNEQILNL